MNPPDEASRTLPVIDVQYVHLSDCRDASLLSQYLALLSPDEARRHASFVFDKDRHRYLVSRVLLRTTLARHLCKTPQDIMLTYGPYGKPALADHADATHAALNFNLTHADDMALVAVTRGRWIGVDLERIDRPAPIDVGLHQFHMREVASLRARAGDAEALCKHFWRLWTLKESLVKATGLGLTIPLNRFDVSHLVHEEAHDDEGTEGPLCQPGTPEAERAWHLVSWRPTDQHIAALCVERDPKCDVKRSVSSNASRRS